MYILEQFSNGEIIDSMYAFDNQELSENKVKMIKQMDKDEILYISELSRNYEQTRIINKITKLTKRRSV